MKIVVFTEAKVCPVYTYLPRFTESEKDKTAKNNHNLTAFLDFFFFDLNRENCNIY